MSGYIKFYDEAARWLRVVLSALGITATLYRLFTVIIDKAADKMKLVYLILGVIPFIGTVIWVLDIVWCARNRPLPTCFADITGGEMKKEDTTGAVEAEVTNEKKDAE